MHTAAGADVNCGASDDTASTAGESVTAVTGGMQEPAGEGVTTSPAGTVTVLVTGGDSTGVVTAGIGSIAGGAIEAREEFGGDVASPARIPMAAIPVI